MTRIIHICAALVATGSALVEGQTIPKDVNWHLDPLPYANATSVLQQIPGYNDTGRYPGAPIQGWTMSYVVVNRQVNESSAWTGAVLSHLGPESLGSYDTPESWGHCEERLYLDFDPKDLPTVDPLCRGVVSDNCQKALVDFVKDSKLCFTETDALPEECASDFTSAERSSHRFNQSGPVGGYSFESDVFHAPNNLTLYDSLVKRVVVSLIGFAPNEEEFDDPDTIPTQRLQGVLSCLRASDFKDGSRTFAKGQPTKSPQGTPTGTPQSTPGSNGGSNGGDTGTGGVPPESAGSTLRSAFGCVVALGASFVVGTMF